MITVAETAEMLDTYPLQVRRLIGRGDLPGAKKISDKRTASFLIPLKSVKAYISQKKRAVESRDSSAR